jgi:hypothetical protein
MPIWGPDPTPMDTRAISSRSIRPVGTSSGRATSNGMGPAVLGIRSRIIQESKPSRPSTPSISNERLRGDPDEHCRIRQMGGFLQCDSEQSSSAFCGYSAQT